MAILRDGLPRFPILIVDDDKESCLALSATLRTIGITEIRMVSDSAAVPAMLKNEVFSLVLLDLNMPGLSGYQILEIANELVRRPPFIIVTSSPPPPDFVFRFPHYVLSFLKKPVDRERLVEAVHGAFDESK